MVKNNLSSLIPCKSRKLMKVKLRKQRESSWTVLEQMAYV
jgi:hypothetical protein